MISINGRKITIPVDEKVVGIAGDNQVETRTFQLGRMYNDTDLSEFDFKLAMQNGVVSCAADLSKTVNADNIILLWTITSTHTSQSGLMRIQVQAYLDGEKKWFSNTDIVKVKSSIKIPDDPDESEDI